MAIYGSKNEFAIEIIYGVDDDPNDIDFKKDPILWQRYGAIYFWVNGINIFEQETTDLIKTYVWHLEVMLSVFAEQLKYYLTDDPFPIAKLCEDESLSGMEMVNRSSHIYGQEDTLENLLKVDWNSIDEEETERVGSWMDRHLIYRHRDISIFPDICIQKRNNLIEISWEPATHETNNGIIRYCQPEGVEYINIDIFKKVMIDVCQSFVDRCKEHHYELVKPIMTGIEEAKNIDI